MSTTNPTDVITEWDELQIKFGNYPERPKPITNAALTEAAIEFAENKDVLEGKSLKELTTLEDEVSEDELAAYRKKRLDVLKQRRARYKYGEVIHISKDEYVSQVTECSKASPDLRIVIHLYSESKPVCIAMNQAFAAVARRHGNVKFCKAIAGDVIPKFPESQIPTVLVYKNGNCVQQFPGAAIWGGENVIPDCIEWVLWKNGIIEFSSVDEDPRTNQLKTSTIAKTTTSDYYVRYDLATTELEQANNGYKDHESSEEEKEDLNPDGRGYSSLLMERALRLK